MINGFIVAILLGDQFNDMEASMLTSEITSWPYLQGSVNLNVIYLLHCLTGKVWDPRIIIND